jgi:hypothetical protein
VLHHAPHSTVLQICSSSLMMKPAHSADATTTKACTRLVTFGRMAVMCARATLHIQFNAAPSSARPLHALRHTST